MKRLEEGDSFVNTGFANQFLHPLSQIDQFEPVPRREIKHMCYNNWCDADAGKLSCWNRWGHRMGGRHTLGR